MKTVPSDRTSRISTRRAAEPEGAARPRVRRHAAERPVPVRARAKPASRAVAADVLAVLAAFGLED